MKHLSKLLPGLTAACILLLIFLFAWQCVDIYFFAPAASSIFTYEDVASHLKSLLPLAVVCVILVVLTFFLCPNKKSLQRNNRSSFNHKDAYSKSCIAARLLQFVRISLFLIAAVFIIWGVFNGGLYDVFVKAINICTECIGLG